MLYRHDEVDVFRIVAPGLGPKVLVDMQPFWQQVFTQAGITPKYIINIRPPSAVSRSLQERDDLDNEYGYLLWLKYMLSAEQYTRGSERTVISYDRLLEESYASLASVADHFGLALDIAHQQSNSTLDEVMDKTLRHHRDEHIETGNDNILKLANSLYTRLLQANFADDSGETAKERQQAGFNQVKKDLQALLPGNNTDMLFRLVQRHIQRNDKYSELGDLHSLALSTIKQKDSLLASLDKEKEYVQGIVQQRDTELAHANSEQERLAKLFNHADEVIKERDSQIQQLTELFNHAEQVVKERESHIQHLTDLFSHAEQVVKKRDKQLQQLSSEHDKLYTNLRSNILAL